MNNSKQAIKNLIQDHGSIAQQLHQIRSSKQLSLKQVCIETGLPEYVVDSLEIGHGACGCRIYIFWPSIMARKCRFR